MSTIPAGLRSDYMRARMEDKATIKNIGGLYMGSTQAVTFKDADSSGNPQADIHAYATRELVPGEAGLPLVSNGLGRELSYRSIGLDAVGDKTITALKLGAGTLITSESETSRYVLDISEDPNDSNVLVIRFYPETD